MSTENVWHLLSANKPDIFNCCEWNGFLSGKNISLQNAKMSVGCQGRKSIFPGWDFSIAKIFHGDLFPSPNDDFIGSNNKLKKICAIVFHRIASPATSLANITGRCGENCFIYIKTSLQPELLLFAAHENIAQSKKKKREKKKRNEN